MQHLRVVFFGGLIILACISAVAQQTDISRYSLFTGFDYMISPARNLTERGFEADFGVTIKPWLALGGDFGAMGTDVLSGAGTIWGTETIYAPAFRSIGIDPAAVKVPFTSTTYTFAAGPQLYLRKWDRVTLFARPGLGGIHEDANFTLPPGIGQVFLALGLTPPNPHQTDTQLFFGLGGGFDVKINKHVGMRFATDWVNTHLFSNILTGRQNYIRMSIGPVWHWGQFPK